MPLTPGNGKLGKVANWSIPAIKSCPGRSGLCEDLCYADQGSYLWKTVRDSHEANWAATRKAGWTAQMIADVKKQRSRVVRIHCAGDFYSAEYVHKWIKVIEACPEKVFYAYTRSWNGGSEAMRKALLQLGRMQNVQLWYSVDKETGCAPRHKGVKLAYMAINDDDIPKFKVDLIFRVIDKTVMKKVGDAQVCPYEVGIPEAKAGVTCERCRICFKDAQPLVQLSA